MSRVRGISLDVSDAQALEREIAAHDLVVSLVPFHLHKKIIKAAIKGGTNVVMPGCVSPAIRKLEPDLKKAGIVVLHEACLDLGIEQMNAMRVADEVHAAGGTVKELTSYAGNLLVPDHMAGLLAHHFLWNSHAVLMSLYKGGSFYQGGEIINVEEGPELLSFNYRYPFSRELALFAYPTHDSKPFREAFNIPEAETVIRGQLCCLGFPVFARVLARIGFIDQELKEWLKENLTWAEIMQIALGTSDCSEATLVSKIKAVYEFCSAFEELYIIKTLRTLGLFSSEKAAIRAGNLLDTLCGHLEARMMGYERGKQDLVLLEQRFIVQAQDGTESLLKSTFQAYGSSQGYPARAGANGLPCGIAAQLVLDGTIRETGIQAPYSKSVCDAFHRALVKEGISFVQEVSR